MSNDKHKQPRGNSENTPKERSGQEDSRRNIPSPEGLGGYIGESQKQQDSLRKAMEAPPRPPKSTKGSNNDNKD
jgi:hypothetical protein